MVFNLRPNKCQALLHLIEHIEDGITVSLRVNQGADVLDIRFLIDLFEQKLVLRELLWLLCLYLRAELVQLDLHAFSLLLYQLGEVLSRVLNSLFHLLSDHAGQILLGE